LRDCVNRLRADGYEIIPITELISRLLSTQDQPFAVLTFDDGYRDNLTEVLPLFEEIDVPFTVYVPTEMLTRRLFAWWLGLKELFLTRNRVEFEHRGIVFECADFESKVASLRNMIAWVQGDYSRAEGLRTTFSMYGVDLAELVERDGLSETDIRSMAKHRLVTVGGHTTSHKALSTLSEKEARLEIVNNLRYLETLTCGAVEHFAYPFGDEAACDSRDAGLVLEAGFQTAVTTRRGLVFDAHVHQPMAIPRIGFNNQDTVRSLACKVRGVSAMLGSQFGEPTVFL